MGGYLDILLFFAIYSFLGWLVESIYKSIMEKRLINSGFLAGFFCPIYGFGALIVLVSTNWINRFFTNNIVALIVSMFFAIFLVTVLEYFTGYILEKSFNCKWWDYSNNFANLHGYICLKNSLFWGGLAFFMLQIVHPLVAGLVLPLTLKVKEYAVIVLAIYFVIDTAKTLFDTLDLRRVIFRYSNISLNDYKQKIIKYKRFFMAFPRLLLLNAGTLNRDVRSILNDKYNQIKTEIKSKFR
ncbi:MAG: hypothetical protein WCI30_06030 [Clostridia bacterium]